MREIVDYEGVRWMAWDITPETAHPITRYESYLQGYLDGWLVFETADGRERRRIHPVPRRWAELPDEELRRLLASAEPTRPPKDRPAAVLADAPPPSEQMGSDPRQPPPAESAAPVESVERAGIRSFLYPGGRLWTVAEVPVQYVDPDGEEIGRAQTVLRFTAGRRTLDLLAWPTDWFEYSEQALADLLWRAFPRTTVDRDPAAPARRRADPRPEQSYDG